MPDTSGSLEIRIVEGQNVREYTPSTEPAPIEQPTALSTARTPMPMPTPTAMPLGAVTANPNATRALVEDAEAARRSLNIPPQPVEQVRPVVERVPTIAPPESQRPVLESIPPRQAESRRGLAYESVPVGVVAEQRAGGDCCERLLPIVADIRAKLYEQSPASPGGGSGSKRFRLGRYAGMAAAAQLANAGIQQLGHATAKLAGGDGFGALIQTTDTVANVMSLIPGPTQAFAIGLKAATGAAGAFTEVQHALLGRINEVAPYSGAIASATAEANLRKLMVDLEESQRNGARYAENLTQWSKFQTELTEKTIGSRGVLSDVWSGILRGFRAQIAPENVEKEPAINKTEQYAGLYTTFLQNPLMALIPGTPQFNAAKALIAAGVKEGNDKSDAGGNGQSAKLTPTDTHKMMSTFEDRAKDFLGHFDAHKPPNAAVPFAVPNIPAFGGGR